jgi:GTPase SAR1 family protein
MFQQSKKQKQPEGLDFITPLVEGIHGLLVILGELLLEVIKFCYQRYQAGSLPVRKIEQKELRVKKETKSENHLGYSINRRKPLELKNIDFSKHSLIVGAAGFGKTNLIYILQEHSLQENKPIIFFDPKGDLEALLTFKELCKKYNRKCYIFSEHYHDSVKLNPLKLGSTNQIVDRIMSAFEWTEPFYKDLCQSVLFDVINELKKQKITISLPAIVALYEEKYKTDKTLGLLIKLQNIHSSDFGKILVADSETKTMAEIRQEKACLYIGLSTQGYGETAMAIGKIFLGELLYNSYLQLTISPNSHESIKNSISVFFDEFGALVTPRFIELQNKCRGAGIQLFLAVQTTSDIDRVHPKLTEQIMENASNFFIFKQRVDYGASLLANAIGTIAAKKQTYRTERGSRQDAGSEREVNELICHPDVIKNLKVGQCILLRHNPTQVDLINIRGREHVTIDGQGPINCGPEMKITRTSNIIVGGQFGRN